MNKYLLPIGLAAFVVVALGVFVGVSVAGRGNNPLGSGSPYEETFIKLATTSTLTSAFTGAGSVSTTVPYAAAKPKKALAVRYLPRTATSTLQLLIEEAIDDNCVDYNPVLFTSTSANEIAVNATGSAATIGGVPYRFPQNGLGTASGTLYGFKIDLPDSTAHCLRFSAKEHTSSTAGIVNATAGLFSADLLMTSN